MLKKPALLGWRTTIFSDSCLQGANINMNMNNTLYLSLGFFITITRNGRINFPELPVEWQRGGPARHAVIDACCRGYQGSIDELVDEVTAAVNGNPVNIRAFIHALQGVGGLIDTKPSAYFKGDTPAKRGAIGAQELIFSAPVSLLAEDGKYLWFNHQGELLARLSMREVHVVAMFAKPLTPQAARALYFGNDIKDKLDEPAFDDVLSRLVGANIVHAKGIEDVVEGASKATTAVLDTPASILQASTDEIVAAHDEAAAASGDRVPVIPVNTDHTSTPAALGMLMAYAIAYDNGRLGESYNFVPLFFADATRIIERASKPGIFMFSNYLWTLEDNLKLSAAVKAANPASITIHGGPSTPKYDRDAEDFFAKYDHVDITVRGEGESTFAEILNALDPSNLSDLSRLKEVTGLSYRTSDGSCRTGDRERIADLDTIPSPYLTGLFDAFGASKSGAILESNRGCPYGCTFCDWGSATLSRVRRFDLDRVFKELEWCAQRQIQTASFADANFGMLERDVDIARKIADMKRTYGYPRTVATNYAKNKVKHLRHIIEILAEVNILTEGVISLQSMDEATLKIIDRSNIKLEKYNELTTEFRQANLPLAADIMMGLPGSTPSAFFSDLQKCTDRDVRVRANPTMLLTNSPMNDPVYRKEHGIVALPGELLKETATYTRAQWEDMNELRIAFNLFDNWGVLRYVGRHVRSVTGRGEVEFYDNLSKEALRHPQEWPIMATALRTLEQHMAPPGSWGLFIDEVRRYLVEKVGLADDSALQTALKVQLAHLPAPDRVFPYVLQLEHDYAAWQKLLLAAREGGHRDDWQDHIPQLSECAPATLTVNDPHETCSRSLGMPMGAIAYTLRSWEMDSPVARPTLGMTTVG